MEDSYLDILKDWEIRVADPAVYESIDVLFPEFAFRRVQRGSERDHWASRYKMDLTLPRVKNAEKTVVYRSEMRFREQGNWPAGISVMDKIIQDQGLSSVYEAYRYVASRLVLDMPRPDSKEVAEAVSRQQRLASLQQRKRQELQLGLRLDLRRLQRRRALVKRLRPFQRPFLRRLWRRTLGRRRFLPRQRRRTPQVEPVSGASLLKADFIAPWWRSKSFDG